MFTEEDTQIYKYWDGEKYAYTDPIEIQINLEANDPDFKSNFKVLFDLVQISKDKDAAKEIVKLGRAMFNIKDPNESNGVGLTSMGVMLIVMDFINWIDNLKKNIEDTPTSVLPTETQESN